MRRKIREIFVTYIKYFALSQSLVQIRLLICTPYRCCICVEKFRGEGVHIIPPGYIFRFMVFELVFGGCLMVWWDSTGS